MSNIDKKLPSDIDKLKEIANKTDNPQMKRAIEKRIETISNDKIVQK